MIVKGNEIDIRIDHAEVISFSYTVDGSIRATLGLFSGQERITDFTVNNDTWTKDDAPNHLNVGPALQVACQAAVLAIRQAVHYQLNTRGKMLPTGDIHDEERDGPADAT